MDRHFIQSDWREKGPSRTIFAQAQEELACVAEGSVKIPLAGWMTKTHQF
ncbi:hypothetical protein [Desertivirga arenae]|nr:hypothetical protein [Pedobacter sp. SYSU D00823]